MGRFSIQQRVFLAFLLLGHYSNIIYFEEQKYPKIAVFGFLKPRKFTKDKFQNVLKYNNNLSNTQIQY
ncbi:MAG: hypothetical protein Solumvirus1_21 [Solumvirus sp.]|uniref:Uncharacterized protein n=1 Tax=Solumvirus sp. TaxID=2487773 RepID=A0A3G5AG04_9VIRU|nr:MAG: hypothetical protein Solumvirus1_21 [Solumvirus sp.]